MTGEDVRGRRSRVVPAPDAGVKPMGVVHADRYEAPQKSVGDGGKRARLTGEITKQP